MWTVTDSPQTNDSERGITMKKIGAITVGQSPRVDLIPEIQPILGDSVEIIQAGALDGLSKEEIAKFVPRPGENVLVSRLTEEECRIPRDSQTEPQRHSGNPTFFPACSFALTISNSRVFP